MHFGKIRNDLSNSNLAHRGTSVSALTRSLYLRSRYGEDQAENVNLARGQDHGYEDLAGGHHLSRKALRQLLYGMSAKTVGVPLLLMFLAFAMTCTAQEVNKNTGATAQSARTGFWNLGTHACPSQAEAARATMNRMEALGLALENYRQRHGKFPEAMPAAGRAGSPVAAILDALAGSGVGGLSGVDGWGHPIFWASDGSGYSLQAPGADGRLEKSLKTLGPSESWDTDIIYANGRFLTWPCDVANPPDPDMPCFVMDTGNASVLSIKKPLKLPQPDELENAGASVGAGVVDLLTGFARNVVVDGAQAAGPNPYLAGLTVAVTYLQRKADQLYDPVTILPLARGFRLHEDGDHVALSAGEGTATVLPVVVLDFLKVAANGGRVDPGRYGGGLDLWVRGGFPPFESLESRELMSAGQLQALRGDKTYIVVPRLPLDFRIYESRCRKCEGADGTLSFKLGAGARYGVYGRPGTTHEDEVPVEVRGGASRSSTSLEEFSAAPDRPAVHMPEEEPTSKRVVGRIPGSRRVEPILGMVFRYIPRGSFQMGSPPDEPTRYNNEKQYRVRITRGFWMGETEVTQGQWKALMGTNPSRFKNCGDDCPVEKVSWFDAVKYANALSRKAGLSPCYEISGSTVSFKGLGCEGYRLPTESEWEYAARAGTTGPYWPGRCLSTDEANYCGWYPLEGCRKGEYCEKTVPVRSFRPNPWGLYEVHGNVWEWCWDWYAKEYPHGTVTDPLGPSWGSNRVLRGGSWINTAGGCRSAFRGNGDPGLRGSDLGFRLARTVSK